MSNEATVRVSLRIRKVDSTTGITQLDYQGQHTAFTADVTGTKGPTPGAITAHTYGTIVDLSQLTTPGFCRFMNLDATNYVEVGIWDADIDKFYPLIELLPGESYPLRLSRLLGKETDSGASTGTGTTGGNNFLMVRANAADCDMLVEAFER